MARIAGINTQTNAKGIISKITVDVKNHPQAKQALTQIGIMANSKEDMEREAFYKKINNPTNMTLDEARKLSYQHIDSLKWDN